MTNKRISIMAWFPFNISEAQVTMSTMTAQERGIWISLLTRCSVIGYLEPNWRTLKIACGVTEKFIPTIQRILEENFILENGVWIHPMLKTMQDRHSQESTKAKQELPLPKKPLESRVGNTDREIEREIERKTERKIDREIDKTEEIEEIDQIERYRNTISKPAVRLTVEELLSRNRHTE